MATTKMKSAFKTPPLSKAHLTTKYLTIIIDIFNRSTDLPSFENLASLTPSYLMRKNVSLIVVKYLVLKACLKIQFKIASLITFSNPVLSN